MTLCLAGPIYPLGHFVFVLRIRIGITADLISNRKQAPNKSTLNNNKVMAAFLIHFSPEKVFPTYVSLGEKVFSVLILRKFTP